ncbi:MAG TPA: ATP-binding protein [Streptosporangiaceae bacterium]|nr:ATP-binding protein [Streptosporangiaceae bacterium]
MVDGTAGTRAISADAGEYAGEARQGEGRLVLVSGESGMGKTALLEAFQPRTKGARWLWGVCDGLLTRPLGLLFDIASQVGAELADLSRGQVAPGLAVHRLPGGRHPRPPATRPRAGLGLCELGASYMGMGRTDEGLGMFAETPG